MKFVGDRWGKRRAEDRYGRCVDNFRPVSIAARADRFQQRPGAVEIDGVTLLEVDLGLARDDAGEMEDRLRPFRQRLCGFAGFGKDRPPPL